MDEIIKEAEEIDNPFVKSFFLHVNIAYLQPFEDGNKRTARAVANIPLIEAGIVPFSYSGVDRDKYVNSLTKFYEYGDMDDFFAGQILKSYEKNIESLGSLIDDAIVAEASDAYEVEIESQKNKLSTQKVKL